MYTKIMVPLDGSELAECVLPHVEGFMAECQVASLILVQVIEPAAIKFDDTASISATSREVLVESIRKIEQKRRSTALEYLRNVVSKLNIAKDMATIEVLVGRVVESISEYAGVNDVDLIIIATHGRSGISRWVRGSIADRILRSSPVPVLIVRAIESNLQAITMTK